MPFQTQFMTKPAIVYKDSPPSDKKVLWYDTNENTLKAFRPETSAWEAVTDIDKIISYILVLGGD